MIARHRPTAKREGQGAERFGSVSDEDLMGFLARRDPEAFAAFYDRHAGPAYSLAYRIVGDRDLAEDVTQEAFLSTWRAPDRYDGTRGSVRTWLLAIVRNRAIDSLRRAAARPPAVDLETSGVLETFPAEWAAETESQALRQETAQEVHDAVARLPADQARVLELAYFGGFSQSEIAEMLGAPLGTIKGRMRLGLERIRAALTEGAG